jgi:hypothetical protein
VQNASHVDVTTPLSWLPGSNAVGHAVYFGTVNPPPFLTNTADATLAVSGLAGTTTYYWRVDESTPDSTVAGAVWSFVTRNTNSLVYEWKFAGSNLAPALGNGVMTYADGATTSNQTQFGVTDGILVPHIRGQTAHYLHAPAFTSAANGYLVAFTGSARNGGGDYINQYTAVFDFLLPGTINWFPFFNTNPTNSNDADFYVAPDGSIGIGAIGYSASGLVAPNTWYRIAFVADLANATVQYYLNGNLVCTGSAEIDGRHSIYSDQMPGADLRLLNEGDTSGVYTHEVYLSDFFFTDRAMTDAEVKALGGPKARGVMVPPTPVQLSISLQSTNVLLTWSGGDTPYQVQKTDAPGSAPWQNIGSPTSGTSLLLPVDADARFYRILGP